MTDREELEREPVPEIRQDQERHPPKRHDDPDSVVNEEERFGMAVPIMTLIIGLVFIIVIALYWIS